MDKEAGHVPVLVTEVVELLKGRSIVVDATVGAGGHARLLAEKVGPEGRIIGLDQDPEMLALAQAHLGDTGITLVRGSFEDLPSILQNLQIPVAHGVFADLGFCSKKNFF